MTPIYSPENARAMLHRIKKAETLQDLEKVDRSMDRLWDLGAFKAHEFTRLSVAVMDRSAAIRERGAE
jgi:hypothetical protein